MSLNLFFDNWHCWSIIGLLWGGSIRTLRADMPLRVAIEHTNELVAAQHERTPLAIVYTGPGEELARLCAELHVLLERSGHLRVKVLQEEAPRQIPDITHHFAEGHPFVLYLAMQPEEAVVHGRLYDTCKAVMLEGKQWQRRKNMRAWTHIIAHDIWMTLLGIRSSFLSSIVYVRRLTTRHGAVHSELVATDWDGSEARVIARRPTIVVSPTWLQTDEIAFSEFTPTNVRLMKTNSRGEVRVTCDLPGTIVGASTNARGDIIYCRSGTLWRCIYNKEEQIMHHEPIIQETQPCTCPVLLANGDLIYVMQGVIKRWYTDSGVQRVLVEDQFCTTPAICEAAGTLVYSARVQQHMQLFMAQLDGSVLRQLTRTPGDKLDPAISPCGTFVVYCHRKGDKSSICILNILTNKTWQITDSHEYAACPAWSS